MEYPIQRNHLPFLFFFCPPSLPQPSLLTPLPSLLMDQGGSVLRRLCSSLLSYPGAALATTKGLR